MDGIVLAKLPNGCPEVYLSFQGEGAHVGLPAVFVRLSNCNLHCIWCDTSYTWNFRGTKFSHRTKSKVEKKEEQLVCSVEKLVDIITKVAELNRLVIFTGGEPALQQRQLIKVMNALRGQSPAWKFHLETNSTIVFTQEFDKRIDFYNCSPKLESSGNARVIREKREVMSFLSKAARNKRVCFKFVIGKKFWHNDICEVNNLARKYCLPSEAIYLMPEGEETPAMIQWAQELMELCIEAGFQVSPRLHIIIHGSKRGI